MGVNTPALGETDKLEEVNGCHKLEGLLKHRRCVQPRSTAPPAPLAAASMMARMHRPWFLFIVVVLVVLKARSTCTVWKPKAVELLLCRLTVVELGPAGHAEHASWAVECRAARV
jgi:hypothetical protein